jgi:hypothetical protein
VSSSRRTEILVWFGILAAPAAWTIEHVFGYGWSEATCNPGGGASTTSFHVGAAVLSGAGVLIGIAGLLAGISVLRATESHEDPPPGGRLRMLAAVSVTATPLFIVIMILSAVGALTLDACRPG